MGATASKSEGNKYENCVNKCNKYKEKEAPVEAQSSEAPSSGTAPAPSSGTAPAQAGAEITGGGKKRKKKTKKHRKKKTQKNW